MIEACLFSKMAGHRVIAISCHLMTPHIRDGVLQGGMTSSMPKRRGAPTNYGAMQIFNAMPSSVVDKDPAAARRAAEKVADENRARTTYIPSSGGVVPHISPHLSDFSLQQGTLRFCTT